MKIVHISDLHFGDMYKSYALLRGRWWKYAHDPDILGNLADTIVDLRPDAIVVSGDIVNKENPRAFTEAARFIQAIARRLNLEPRKQVIVIPGNHDAPILRRLGEDPLSRIQGFRSFMAELYGVSAYETKERNVWLFPQHRVCIFGFDSTLKGRTEDKHHGAEDVSKISEGAIGKPQLKWFRDTYSDLQDWITDFDNYYKLAVVHHHPFPLGTHNQFMQFDDADDFLTDLSTRPHTVDLILHGHKHIPRSVQRGYDDHSFLVFSAGTALFGITDEQQGFGNNFNVITIDRVRVTCERYSVNEHKRFVLEPDQRFEGLNRKTVWDAAVNAGLFSENIRKILDLQLAKEGKSVLQLWFEGFQPVGSDPHAELTRSITADNPGARVESLELIPEGTELERIDDFKNEGIGTNKATYTVRFKDPLNRYSRPLRFALRWTISNGHCMERAKFKEFYPEDDSFEEETGNDFLYPVANFTYSVLFPAGYIVEPKLTLTKNGAVIENKRLEFDLSKHEVEWSGTNLSLGMGCKISWPVPG